MIDKGTIDRIFDAANIVEVVSDFISLKKRGVNYLGNCPFHNEKTPSFTVSPGKGIYKCFGCGKGGNSVNFVMEHEQLSYVETLKWLAKKYNIEVVEKEITPEQKEQADARESMLIVSGFAQKVFSHNLFETEEGKAVGLSYFNERGFTEKTINKFELGYCRKGYDVFSKQAISKGYKEKYLVESGLTIKRDNDGYYDRFNERVMFPIHNLMGKVIGFGGRTLRSDKKTAKYLNSPESKIYHKSKVLYGIYFAKKSIIQNDKCYLVEGYTDVLSMHQAGIENVVSSSGTALSPDQIRLIKRFAPNVTVLYDGDAAGIKAALRGIDLVLEEGLNVKVVLLPDGEDPDSFARKHNATEFYDFIKEQETDFITFKTKLLLDEVKGDPVKKAHLISDIVRTISVIPDTITRALYIKECSNLMQVDEKILYSEINKILYKEREKRWNREQPSPINPAGQALNLQLPTSDKYELFEKEIIRLLLNYSEKVLFNIATDDNQPEEKINTRVYICRELKDEIEIKNPAYNFILKEFESNLLTSKILHSNYFINHENQLVANAAADLLAQNHQISKMWSKKGTYITTEEDDLKKVIDNAISGYKYELVLNILQEIEKELKDSSGKDLKEEDLKLLYDKYMMYTQFKIEISKSLGDRIILKR
ncbi:MAG: DNA primase [Salinivirgaceae bacterium]|jgi:DNA primase|nr:DNA primase [Salinivirgaceae bacterium]